MASIFDVVPRRFMAAQLRRPSGLFGRFVIAPKLNQANALLNQTVLAALDLGATDRVLEVGFGGGDLISRMLPLLPDGQVVGADFSPDMVGLCSNRFSAAVEAGRLRLACCPVEALSLPSASIDKACSVNTIYFWPDLPAAIAELRRVIAPGGRLVLGFAPRETLETLPVTAHGFCMYEIEEVSAALRDAGFADVTFTMIDNPRGADCLMVSHNPLGK